MLKDLSQHQTATFPGINDAPVPPTASKAGNGSDLISKVNALINDISSSFNTLDTNLSELRSDISSSNTFNWSAKLPTSTNYIRLEVYYLNSSENYMYNSPSINLSFVNLVATYTLNENIAPSGFISMSSVIKNYGIGYYFFLFRNTETTFKSNTFIGRSANEAIPSGAMRLFEKDLTVSISDNGVDEIIVNNIKPLVVAQTIATVEFLLFDESFEIG